MKQPIKMTPGDDLHLTLLMAPHSLNLAVGQFRQQLLGYGRAAFEAGKAGQCPHQIQEPAPVTAIDALREAEAALEIAIARILKANLGHSISVTSEAKALVAVRSALAATPAEKSNSVEFDGIKTAAPVVLPEPWGCLVEGRIFIGRLLPQHVSSMVDAEGFQPTKLYTEPQLSTLLAGVSAPAAQAMDTDSLKLLADIRAMVESTIKAGLVDDRELLHTFETIAKTAAKAKRPTCAICDTKGFIAFDDESARRRNNGKWGSCKACSNPAPQAQADARDAWQPIESAPKDGAWIQLWRTPEPEESPASSTPLVIGRWSDEEEAFVWPDDPFYDPFTAHGKESADRMVEALRTYLSNEFTHWAPLSMPSANIAAQAAAQGGA